MKHLYLFGLFSSFHSYRGIRVPMIVKWPGVVKAGDVADQYVIVEDFFPSILEIAGVRNYETLQKVDGKSFFPILRNAKYRDDDRALIWHMPNKWQPDGPGINYKSAIRRGQWKLVYHMRDGKVELFDVRNDIGETIDLAGKNPKRVKEMSDLLFWQLRQWHARMPVDKKSGKPVSLPN